MRLLSAGEAHCEHARKTWPNESESRSHQVEERRPPGMAIELPEELIEAILESGQLERSDILTLCVLSKSWSDVATRRLYSQISFHEEAWPIERIQCLLQTLRTTTLGSLCRHLYLWALLCNCSHPPQLMYCQVVLMFRMVICQKKIIFCSSSLCPIS